MLNLSAYQLQIKGITEVDIAYFTNDTNVTNWIVIIKLNSSFRNPTENPFEAH